MILFFFPKKKNHLLLTVSVTSVRDLCRLSPPWPGTQYTAGRVPSTEQSLLPRCQRLQRCPEVYFSIENKTGLNFPICLIRQEKNVKWIFEDGKFEPIFVS